MLIRVRTKDGTERLNVADGATLDDLRQLIASQLGVPLEQQLLSRSEQKGPVATKGEAFSAPGSTQLAGLSIRNGDLLFLDYQMERENQAQTTAYANDPFRQLVKEGELRQQGTTKWTLTSFLDYRGSKEFVLTGVPEPVTKFVMVDERATNQLLAYMQTFNFQCKRVGYLYGRWAEDEAGQPGVQVHAIYEPPQDCNLEEIRLLDDVEGEEKLAKLSAALGLVRVGVIIFHPARQYTFSVNELLLAARLHHEAIQADPDKGRLFVTMEGRPVLETEETLDGIATTEAYQLSEQCVAMAAAGVFSQSKTDPRVAKSSKDMVFIVEKAEQRKTELHFFYAPVPMRPFTGLFSHSFAVENRPTEPQDSHAMATYLRRTQRDGFLKAVSEFHFLLFLCNMLDVNVDMPVLCSKILEGNAAELDGFKMMIYCYAGLET